MTRLFRSFSLLAALSAGACSLPQNTELVGLYTPARSTFPLVADALQPSCGTLDCHGQRGRNLRLYGGRGLRLDPRGNAADEPTTDAEYEASFRSLTSLEPETLDEVVLSGGTDPERLTLVRKARGVELHKGGIQMLPGDPLDRCLLSWIAGQVQKDSCTRVVLTPRPSSEKP